MNYNVADVVRKYAGTVGDMHVGASTIYGLMAGHEKPHFKGNVHVSRKHDP